MKKKRGIYKIRKTINIILVAACFIVFTALLLSIKSIIVEATNLDTSSFTQITGKDIDEGDKPSNETLPKYDVLITINNGKEVGIVRDDFYGVNTHGYWLRFGQDLDWHKQTFLDGGYTVSREDMNLADFYSDGTDDWSVIRKGGAESIIKEYKWAREKGVKIINIINYMPKWLADNSSGKCANLEYCPPKNYTYFGELVKDYINRTTLDGEYLDMVSYEFWNEPDVFFFMGMLPDKHPDKSIEINKMFNATATIVRQAYPNIIIGGLGLADCYATTIRNNFLGNFSDPNALNFSNFFSCHNFVTANFDIYPTTQTKLKNIYSNCTVLNAEETCKNIYLTEFNLGHSTADDWIKNTTARENEYETRFSLFYASVLNSFPENVTMQTYQWANEAVYGPGYSEYPHQWHSVQGPNLGIEYLQPYNVTKDFVHYHSGGNIIVNSSSNNNSIKSVASLNPDDIWHITIINTGTSNISVSINVSSTNIEELKDLETDEIYPVNNGLVNVGILTEYNVKHYEGVEDYNPPEESEEEVKENSSSSGGSHSSKSSSENTKKSTPSKDNEIVHPKPNTSTVILTKEIMTFGESEKEKKTYGPERETEEEIILSSQDKEHELDGKRKFGFGPQSALTKNYIIIIMLLGSIICTVFIIVIVYRKRKN